MRTIAHILAALTKRSPSPSLVRDTRGATAVEYGLIVACIVIVMVVSLHGLADVTTAMWNSVSQKVEKAS